MDRFYLVCASLVVFSASLNAEPIQVNTRQTDAQCNPSLARLSAGGFVVVWSSYYGSSGRSNEIMARRFDSAGQPLDADEFQVNTTSAGNHTEPAVAPCPIGGFVAVWQGPSETGTAIYGQVFDPNGAPAGHELHLSEAVVAQCALPRVAVAADGLSVVVWEESETDDTLFSTVWGQLLGPAGEKIGKEFLIAADMASCRYPDVATDSDGNFIVTWLLDRSSKSVWGRLFDAAGVPFSECFEITEDNISSLTRPTVAMHAGGPFVVTWDGDPNLASRDHIHGRCYGPDGEPLCDPFVVNNESPGAAQWPRVAINDANDIVFIWQQDNDDPNGSTSIWARRFDLSGRPSCEAFPLVDIPGRKQRYPDVAVGRDGKIVAVWESAASERSDYDILAAVEPLPAWPDLTGDGRVDLGDLAALSLFWGLDGDGLPADLNADGLIDTTDLQILCCHWLQ